MPTKDLDLIIEILSVISSSPSSASISADTPIIESGYIDSFSVFQVIAELENHFGISIGVMDATINDFSTPAAIYELVDRMRIRKDQPAR